MVSATITSKGQITIPKAVRNSLHLHSGDRLEFIVHGQSEATLKPMTKSVDDVFGQCFKHGRKVKTVEEMSEAISRRMKASKL
jgi:AbrB family looped-hinge helix DNA binding protein